MIGGAIISPCYPSKAWSPSKVHQVNTYLTRIRGMKKGCELGVRLLAHLQRVGEPRENIRGVDVRNTQRDSENRTEEPED